MLLLARGAGRPARIALARSIVQPAALTDVVTAIAEYARSGGRTVYVERCGDRYRWSPAERGGAYPLTRVVARFLACDHTELTVGFETVDGWSVVGAAEERPVDSRAVIADVPDDPVAVEQRITRMRTGVDTENRRAGR